MPNNKLTHTKPKKTPKPKKRSVKEELIKEQIKNKKYKLPVMLSWSADLGRRLQHYERVHTYLLTYFGSKKLRNARFVHLGSGNTNYCDYLTNKFKTKTFAIDRNSMHLEDAKKRGSKAIRVKQDVHKLKIRPNSVDIFLSDHFLFSNFAPIKNFELLAQLAPALKKDGLLIIERCNLNKNFQSDLKKIGLQIVYINKSKKFGPVSNQSPNFVVIKRI